MKYDTFLCYNSKNLKDVSLIFEYLVNSQIEVFFDKQNLLPGDLHDKIIDNAIKNSDSVLVFIGKTGIGPWQEEEIYSTHWESIINKKIIIPIILPNASIEDSNIPGYLKSRSKVQFQNNVEEEDVLQLLIDGILRRLTSKSDKLEQPISDADYNLLFRNTIRAYDNQEMATKFYDVWKNDIPLNKLESFLKHLPIQSKILDAGCGPGHHSHHLARNNYEVIGIDVSDASLKIAKTDNSNASFIDMDMRRTKFKNNEFDGVWACASCVHTPVNYFGKQISEFVRIVKPGGIIGITLMIGRLPAVEKDKRFFEGYISSKEILDYFEPLNMEILEITSKVLRKNTEGIKKVSNWFTVVTKTPQTKKFIFFNNA